MSNQLFHRACFVTVSKQGVGLLDSGLGNSRRLQGRIQFKIVSDTASGANKCTLVLFNLSKPTLDFLAQENLVYILSAGYMPPNGTGAKALFIGKPNEKNGFHSQRKGANVLTKIELGDSEQEIEGAFTNISIKETVSLNNIITMLLNDFNLSIGHQDRLPEVSFQNGFSASGKISKILDDLGKKAGFEWSVQSGQVIILQDRNTINQTGYVVSKNTGMVGTPIKSKEKIGFQTLINNELRPGVLAVVESDILGRVEVRIDKVTYNGDSWEGNWTQKIEGTPRPSSLPPPVFALDFAGGVGVRRGEL